MKILKAADLFCGAGGTSTGLIEACKELGLDVKLTAINHWNVAIATHTANHPNVVHHCASLETLNPRTLLGKLGIMWASPECMHHSIALGGKPINDQSRSTAWHIVQWAEALQPDVILVENVKEFRTWGPCGTNGRPLKRRRGEIFQSWVKCIEALGYKVDHRILRAADFGDPTTRERLFIQAVRGKRKIAWPTPTHAESGKGSSDMFRKALKDWVPAYDIIDWEIPSRSIFDRKKPLSEKTMRRIWIGLEKFGLKPFIVPGQSEREGQKPRTHDMTKPMPTVTATGHSYLVQVNRTNGDRVKSLEKPLGTVCGNGEHAIATPFIMATDQTGGKGNCVNPLTDPLTTVVTKQRHAIVSPTFIVRNQGQSIGQSLSAPLSTVMTQEKHALAQCIVKLRGNNIGQSVDTPLHTVTGGGTHHALAMLMPQQSAGRMREVDEPVPTVATDGAIGLMQAFILKYYGNSDTGDIRKPLDSQTTKQRFGLVRPFVVVDGQEYVLDIHFRMLQPKELAAAQGFPSSYEFTGTKTEIVKQIGNAVPVNLAKALCKAVLRESIRVDKRAA